MPGGERPSENRAPDGRAASSWPRPTACAPRARRGGPGPAARRDRQTSRNHRRRFHRHPQDRRALWCATGRNGGLREAARMLLPLHGRPGYDYVFVARAGTPGRDWARLLDDVTNALTSLAAGRGDPPRLGPGHPGQGGSPSSHDLFSVERLHGQGQQPEHHPLRHHGGGDAGALYQVFVMGPARRSRPPEQATRAAARPPTEPDSPPPRRGQPSSSAAPQASAPEPAPADRHALAEGLGGAEGRPHRRPVPQALPHRPAGRPRRRSSCSAPRAPSRPISPTSAGPAAPDRADPAYGLEAGLGRRPWRPASRSTLRL